MDALGIWHVATYFGVSYPEQAKAHNPVTGDDIIF